MKLKWITVFWGILLATGQATAAETTILNTYEEKVSYGLGVDMARSFTRMGVEFDADILMKGFKDEVSKGKLLMTEEELRATLSTHYSELVAETGTSHEIGGGGKQEDGRGFPGGKPDEGGRGDPAERAAVQDPEGGQRQETDGCRHGRVPLPGHPRQRDRVRQLLPDRDQPATFPVKGLIPGWTEALKLMPVGSKWQLFIPPELAYGERGAASRHVGPNTTLIFELELIAIK